MSKPETDIPEDLRPALLDAVLAHVPFDGWSKAAVRAAARDLDLDPAMAELAYPGGLTEMIGAFSTRADRMAVDALQDRDLKSLKIRERITLAVRLRIEVVAHYREAARSALAHLALPLNAAAGTAMAWATADALWRAVGDTSTDANYYSKRAILSGVFSATVLYWLNDESEGWDDTWGFLDRRIEDVMRIEKAKSHLKKYTDSLPDLTRLVGRLRYPEARSRRG